MTTSDRALARIVLSVLAGLGLIGLVLVLLLDLSAGSARSGARSVRCLVIPITSLDLAVHGATMVTVTIVAAMVFTGYQCWTRQRALSTELKWIARYVRHRELPEHVAGVAEEVGVRRCLHVLESGRPFAFTYGWARPHIAVSTALIERLTDLELAAVLHHENWHRRRHDPTRLLVVHTLTAAFRRVGFVQRLVSQYLVAVEVAADRHATSRMGQSRSLASALLKVMDEPVARPAFAANTDARVACLAGDVVAARSGVGRVAAVAVAGEFLVFVGFLKYGGIPFHTALALVHPIC